MEVFVHGFLSGTVQAIVGHPLDTIKTNLQAGKLGWSGKNQLYKGFFPSLIGGCLQNGSLFCLEKETSKFTENKIITGFLSGVATAIFVSPLERWKCGSQTGMMPKGPWYQGLVLTMARDGLGFAGYFYVYESMRQHLDVFWSGGMAGMVSWWISYPFDTKKTAKQLGIKPNSSSHFLGLGVVSLRAFLVNGGIFYSFNRLEMCGQSFVQPH